MAILTTLQRDLIGSLTWYMSARQTALRAAMAFRSPSTVTDRMDLRIHYSGYFVHLLGATELLGTTGAIQQPNQFFTRLYGRLVFAGFIDGPKNYSYVRELRNSVVHRGLDITACAHTGGGFPMFLAPEAVTSQPDKDGHAKKRYVAFATYLLELIAKCESVIGPTMIEFMEESGILNSTIDAEAAAVEYREFIEQSQCMPEFAKTLARATDFKPEWAIAAHETNIRDLRAALQPLAIEL